MLVTPPEWVQATITRFFFDLAKMNLLAMGAGIALGGPRRMTGPAYDALVTWGGGPEHAYLLWGGSLFILGLGTLVRQLDVRRWSYTVATVWFFVWWAAITWTTMTTVFHPPPPGVALPGFTGPIVFFGLALAYTALSVVMWMSREQT